MTNLSPETDDAPYLEALKIPTSPFTSNVELQSFYLDAAREQLLNQLLHLVQSSGLLLVVSAEDGSGKTTLLAQFLQRAGPALRCCPITAAPGISEQDLLSRLATCLDLPDNLNTVATQELLEDQASILQRNDLLPVILVDDAHNLSAGTLATLMQLQRNDHADDDNTDSPWRIVLFTRPNYTAELMQLNARMHFIHLPVMDEQQIGKYLLHRLRMVGYKQASPFTARDIAFIHKHAQGNLTQVHQLGHQVLLKKHTGTKKPMTHKKMQIPRLKLKPGVWIAIAIAIFLSVVLFFQERINNLVDDANETDITLNQQRYELPVPQEFILKKIPDSPPKLIDITRKPESKAITDIEKKTIEEVSPATQVEQKQAEVTTVQAPAKEEPVSKPASLASTVAKPAITQPPKESRAVAKLESMLERHKIHGKSWVMQQAPASFTAQLIGSSKPDILYSMVKKAAVQDNAAIYHVLRKNKDWYVLIYGSYADKETIRKAVDKLPTSLRKGGPWVRSFAAVQAEVKAGKK
jgi:DamX protein